MTADELLTTTEAVIPVPVAGSVIGLGQTASYDAAKRGDLPTIRIGARYLVPVAKFRDLLGLPAWPNDEAPAVDIGEGDKSSSINVQEEGDRRAPA